MKKSLFISLSIMLLAFVISSCNETDKISYDANRIGFASAEMGFDDDETTKTVSLTLTEAVSQATTIKLVVTPNGLTYGEDFITDPVTESGFMTLTIPEGAQSVSFTVTKLAQFYDGTESIIFTVAQLPEDIDPATTSSIVLAFSPIVSEYATMTLNGGEGGSDAANSVFVDFSANDQTAVARTSWSLGFYCGALDVVKINETTGSAAMAVSLDVSDIISDEDATTYSAALKVGQGSGSFDIIDDIEGDLTNYVIQMGSVYLVKLGATATGESELYKVLVTTTDTGYTLQYAAGSSADVTTVQINRNSNYNFVYYSFGQASIVSVEPAQAKWDIRWSKQTYKASATMPYVYADFVTINTFGGVTAVQVFTDDYAYDDLRLSDVSSLEFSSNINAIGSGWRSTSTGIYSDRFYVVKDPADNYYKLRFLTMGLASDGGTRGYPQIEYTLLK